MKNTVVRQILAGIGDTDWSGLSPDRPVVADAVEAEAVRQALPILQRFDRYERRVAARRNRAIRLCFEKVLGDN
jgi:hypothetical protein